MSDRIAVMCDGSIRQIGGPRDIYDRPAERFVADFIGDTNFLTAEIIGTTDNLAQLRLSSVAKTTAQATGQTQGKVTLAIRPEHASLCREDDGLLKGALQQVVYFGTDTHFHVMLDDGTAFVLRQQNGPDVATGFAQGDRVGVTFPPSIAQVLKD